MSCWGVVKAWNNRLIKEYYEEFSWCFATQWYLRLKIYVGFDCLGFSVPVNIKVWLWGWNPWEFGTKNVCNLEDIIKRGGLRDFWKSLNAFLFPVFWRTKSGSSHEAW